MNELRKKNDAPRDASTLWVCESDLRIVREIAGNLAAGSGLTAEYAWTLIAELAGARVCADDVLPPDAVSLDATVEGLHLETGKRTSFRLTLPAASNGVSRVSVAAPLGMAVFGYRAGIPLNWGPSQRPIRFRLVAVRPARPRSGATRREPARPARSPGRAGLSAPGSCHAEEFRHADSF